MVAINFGVFSAFLLVPIHQKQSRYCLFIGEFMVLWRFTSNRPVLFVLEVNIVSKEMLEKVWSLPECLTI